MAKEILQDVDGKESSKRKTGIKLVNVAIIIAVSYIVIGLVMAILNKPFNYVFPFEVWLTFMIAGTGLLGFTLVERFSNRSK